MIVHVLAFFLCASLGTEVCAGTIPFNDRHQGELAAFISGLHVFDANGVLVEITKDHTLSNNNWEGEITFKLYTKQTPTRGHELKINDTTTLKNSGFDPSKPTYMITHGWRNNGNSPSCVLIRDAYLANTDSNVIVLDWSSYSMSINYIDVALKVKGIGERVKLFIKWLYANGLKADDLTLIGHSLGAHVMGLAGYELMPQVNNIVGLDPALPMFNFADDSGALSRKDAKHVQIIHTNAGALGYMCSHGHSDFFLNGGIAQPGCCDNLVTCGACSHFRAVEFFAKSISRSFVGIKCDSDENFENHNCGSHPQTARMGGLNLGSVLPGTYYLNTEYKKPFARVNPDLVNTFPVVLPKITSAACRWQYLIN